jgi:hypothetical protein
MAFVQQFENSVTSSANPLATNPSGSAVTATNALTCFVFYAGTGSTAAAPTGLTVAGNSNLFTYRGLVSQSANGGIAVFTCASANAGTTTLTASFAGFSVQAIYAREDSGLPPFLGMTGAIYAGSGATGNLNSSGSISGITNTSVLMGLTVDTNSTTTVPTAGTGFTGHAGVWSVYGGGTAVAISEDGSATAPAPVVFSVVTGNRFDTFITVGVAFQSTVVVAATQGYIRQAGPGISPDSRYQFSSIVRDTSVPPIFAAANIAEGYDVLVATVGQISASAAIVEGFDSLSAPAGITNVAIAAGLSEGLDIPAIGSSPGTSAAAAIIEGYDLPSTAANIAAVGAAAIHESTDLLTFAASTGIAAAALILEGRDSIATAAGLTITVNGTIFESPDVIAFFASTPSTSTAAAQILEGADGVSIATQVAWIGTASLLEGRDIPALVGFAKTATLVVLEGNDSLVATALTEIAVGAGITEGFDSLTSAGISSIPASAAILEGLDTLASALTATIVGYIAAVEGFDFTVTAGNFTPTQYAYADIVALSQTGIQGVRSAYLENSACFIMAAYFNAARLPMVPTAVSYRVDDLVSGANLVPWTSIVPQTVNEVTITSLQNGIVSYTRWSETHQVLFQITDSFGDVNYARCLFDVVRVEGFSVPDIISVSANIVEGPDTIVSVN